MRTGFSDCPLYKIWDSERKVYLKNISKNDAIFTKRTAMKWLENRNLLDKLNVTLFLEEIKSE